MGISSFISGRSLFFEKAGPTKDERKERADLDFGINLGPRVNAERVTLDDSFEFGFGNKGEMLLGFDLSDISGRDRDIPLAGKISPEMQVGGEEIVRVFFHLKRFKPK